LVQIFNSLKKYAKKFKKLRKNIIKIQQFLTQKRTFERGRIRIKGLTSVEEGLLNVDFGLLYVEFGLFNVDRKLR